jgi:ubiquinol-cytochrome c reductase cytochrome c1 subunit
MRKIIVAVMFAVLPLVGFAAEEGANLEKAHVDLSDKASLQRGAKFFIDNCLSCHSARFMRYNRMGKDLGIPDDVLTPCPSPWRRRMRRTSSVSSRRICR